VKLCAVAAFLSYLQYRFFVTDKFLDFTFDDWLDNSKWFDIKLLVDVTSGDTTAMLKNGSYARKLKEILTHLGLPVSILVHLGRKIGPKVLDCLEEESQDIERLGNWNHGIMMNTTYSSKLPLKPIRAMGGYPCKSFYYIARTAVEPPDELLEATPMGRWLYKALKGVEERVLESNSSKHQTAWHALNFFKDLNKYFLQDAAAMHEERENHEIFQQLPVFKMQEWDEYCAKMKPHLDTDECPLDAKLENVIPGLHQWHRVNDSSLPQLLETVDEIKPQIDNLCSCQETNSNFIIDSLKHETACGLASAAISITPCKKSRKQQQHPSQKPSPSNPQPEEPEAGGLEELNGYFEGLDESGRPNPHPGTMAPKLFMKPKHSSLTSLYKEWYGNDEFDDDFGGVDGRNKMYGCKWRAHIDRQHYSRAMRIVQAIDVTAQENGAVSWQGAVAELEPNFQEANRSLANMVKKLEEKGIIGKGKTRGLRRKATGQSTDDPSG
jgi:hypothetical protein